MRVPDADPTRSRAQHRQAADARRIPGRRAAFDDHSTAGRHVLIDEYVTGLARGMHGPRRLTIDVLTEARHSLLDSAEGYRSTGLAAADAERRAVAEFGDVRQLAALYQVELASATLRALTLRVMAVTLLAAAGANLMWQGAPFSSSPPPSGYLLMSDVLDWFSPGYGLLCAAIYGWLTWGARRGRTAPVRLTRRLAYGVAGPLAASWLGAVVLYAWSVELWDAALTWPPMVVGGVTMTIGYGWLGVGVRSCLATAR